jgi:hypothetical protein
VSSHGCCFDGFNEDFDGVFARAKVDDFECCLTMLVVWLLPLFLPVVDGLLSVDDVDVCFSEALVFVASHTVGGHCQFR